MSPVTSTGTGTAGHAAEPGGDGHGGPEPHWQPISRVGLLSTHVAEQLADSRAQLALLEQARPSRPAARVLDDHLLGEVRRVYGQMAADYRALFAEQARRWNSDTPPEHPAAAQLAEYTRLVTEHLQVLGEILTLAEEIAPHTIESVLAANDAELGLRALLGQTGPLDRRGR